MTAKGVRAERRVHGPEARCMNGCGFFADNAVIAREPASAVLVSPVSPEDTGNVRCAEHLDARILEERSPAGTGDTYLYCPWHSARGLVIGGRGYLARCEFRKADDRP
jgi:hypothetical protein